MGTASDITPSPYTVVGATLFAGRPPSDPDTARRPVAIAVRLEAEGGLRRLAVAGHELDSCFSRSDRPPPKPAEVEALRRWVSSDVEGRDTPKLGFGTLSAVASIERERCRSERISGAPGLSCHAPLLTLEESALRGPFSTPVITLVRERMVGAAHFVDDMLVSPLRAVQMHVLVKAPLVEKEGALARTLNTELIRMASDETAQMYRATTGRFGLVTERDGQKATHHLDVRAKYSVPPVESAEEGRTHRYVAGKKAVPNPEYPGAQAKLAAARNALSSAQREAEVIRERLQALKKACSEGSDVAARATQEALGGGLLGLAGKAVVGNGGKAACSEAALVTERNTADKRLSDAQQDLDVAKARADATPTTRSVDDVREYAYTATHYRRSGTAVAELSIRAAGSDVRLFSHSVQVPFQATSVEVPSVPEVGLVGQRAKNPTDDEVEAELARALTPLIDRTILKWGAQREVGGDVGDVRPGTRSWMVMVARHAAARRPVKLVSDIFENRTEALSHGEIAYPLKVPQGDVRRCWVMGAIPRDGHTDLALTLERYDGLVLARDRRPTPDAAFELCGLRPGKYRLRVSFNRAEPPAALLVALFDSTPGRVSAEDVSASTRGLPTIARRGAVLELDGSGLVAFEGTGGEHVRGTTGDRDGDKISDDIDHCPYEREVLNGYLDDDGCPDHPPANWSPRQSGSSRNQFDSAASKAQAPKSSKKAPTSGSKKKTKTEVYIP